jgi:hypothetical protein
VFIVEAVGVNTAEGVKYIQRSCVFVLQIVNWCLNIMYTGKHVYLSERKIFLTKVAHVLFYQLQFLKIIQ